MTITPAGRTQVAPATAAPVKPAVGTAPAAPAAAATTQATAQTGFAGTVTQGPVVLQAPEGTASVPVKEVFGVVEPAPLDPTMPLVFAGFSEPKEPTIGFPSPHGTRTFTVADDRSDKLKLANGKTATFSWNEQLLQVRTAAGKTVTLVPKNDAHFAELKKEFRDTFKGLTKQDLVDFGPTAYGVTKNYSGLGAAGALVSVEEGASYYFGGAHPSNSSQLLTFDTRTGKPVKLTQLLDAAQFKAVVDQIERQLPTLKFIDEPGEDNDVGAEPFQHAQSREELEELVANNFALRTENGEVVIDVGWESGVHAMSGTMVQFSFQAPTTDAFKKATGADKLPEPDPYPQAKPETGRAIDALRKQGLKAATLRAKIIAVLAKDPATAGWREASVDDLLTLMKTQQLPAGRALSVLLSD